MYTQIRNGPMTLFYILSSTMQHNGAHQQGKNNAFWRLVDDMLFLQTRLGQTLWLHQHGCNKCPFNNKADALAKQVAGAHPLQLRLCML